MADNQTEKQKVQDLTDKLERGLTELFNSDSYRPTSRTDFIEGETLRNEGKGVRDTCRKGCGG